MPALGIMPENKIIDITTIDTECSDSAECMEALARAGSGVTVFTAPKVEENSLNSNAATNSVGKDMLKLNIFQCHRKQNDSAFGPKNEGYWAVASGSD
ncbi:hypothetical protein ACHAO1_004711 [Botrytis cinerea]